LCLHAQLQEMGAHGTGTIVHWRNGCVREGDTRLEDLRDPESACCARDAVLGAGLCLKTRTGARLHKRKCGDVGVDLVQVYAYLDHDDLQTMCIKLRCSICTLCQFKFTVERFLGANVSAPRCTLTLGLPQFRTQHGERLASVAACHTGAPQVCCTAGTTYRRTRR
jgi:hypothetical protein